MPRPDGGRSFEDFSVGEVIEHEFGRTGLVVISDGLGAPRAAPLRFRDAPLLVGWMPVPPEWVGNASALSAMGSPALRHRFSAGRLRYLPVRYSQLPSLLAGPLRPAVAVVSARASGRGFRFSLAVGYAEAAVRAARRVVVEVDDGQPDVDAPAVPAADVEIVETIGAPPQPPPQALDAVDLAIGRGMAGLVPPSATVQYGPGTIGEAAIRSLDVPVRIHSGIVTDGIADLAARGKLDGQALTGYLFGGAPLHELARGGGVRVRGLEETHAAAVLHSLPRFHAFNTALQVGLDGSVNVERVGGTQIGGIGGHPDFSAAAAACPDGLSIVGLRSTRRGASTIVPAVEVVSTSRSDIEVVVTEWGTADLRGKDDDQRAKALIGVAHPDHRDALEREGARRRCG